MRKMCLLIAVAFLLTSKSPAQSCCSIPQVEATSTRGAEPGNFVYVEDFVQTLSNDLNDSFDSRTITEVEGATGTDTCYNPQSPYTAMTTVSGSSWTVAQGTSFVSVNHNQWGPDQIGWPPSVVKYYQLNEIVEGGQLPCGWTLYQNMEINICDGSPEAYVLNTITYSVNVGGVTACRAGTCATALNP